MTLLGDLRELFRERGDPDELRSSTIRDALAAREDRPWAEVSRGRPLTGQKLAALLHGFGVSAVHRRTGYVYRRDDLRDAWNRYLARSRGVEPSHRHEASKSARSGPLRTVTGDPGRDGPQERGNPGLAPVRDGVTLRDPRMDDEESEVL